MTCDRLLHIIRSQSRLYSSARANNVASICLCLESGLFIRLILSFITRNYTY